MPIETFFKKKTDLEFLELDYIKLAVSTNEEFSGNVYMLVKHNEIIDFKAHVQGRKQKFFYFKTINSWFSFAWDKKTKQIIFSKSNNQKEWSFVVGYQMQ